ncbi:MAG TPA: hypothetical protein P5169_09670, partial [Kiritimatiellia bacterium]|jgi:hypothetical protein|nr:hypothetical protein [Kiritimatiellia bacterium]
MPPDGNPNSATKTSQLFKISLSLCFMVHSLQAISRKNTALGKMPLNNPNEHHSLFTQYEYTGRTADKQVE